MRLASLEATSIHTLQTRRSSTILKTRKTVIGNGVTLACTLNGVHPFIEQVVSRKSGEGRITQEANASGKARGYADVGTAIWMVKLPVGVHKL